MLDILSGYTRFNLVIIEVNDRIETVDEYNKWGYNKTVSIMS